MKIKKAMIYYLILLIMSSIAFGVALTSFIKMDNPYAMCYILICGAGIICGCFNVYNYDI